MYFLFPEGLDLKFVTGEIRGDIPYSGNKSLKASVHVNHHGKLSFSTANKLIDKQILYSVIFISSKNIARERPYMEIYIVLLQLKPLFKILMPHCLHAILSPTNL